MQAKINDTPRSVIERVEVPPLGEPQRIPPQMLQRLALAVLGTKEAISSFVEQPPFAGGVSNASVVTAAKGMSDAANDHVMRALLIIKQLNEGAFESEDDGLGTHVFIN
jgi:hypothetical protein